MPSICAKPENKTVNLSLTVFRIMKPFRVVNLELHVMFEVFLCSAYDLDTVFDSSQLVSQCCEPSRPATKDYYIRAVFR